jgi:phosphohistidine swiveling domain-containing protein
MMTPGDKSSIRCEDGTEIPFTWVYPGAEAFEWARDAAHWPEPATPIRIAMEGDFYGGADRAWQESGLQVPPMFFRFQLAGPFLYARMSPEPPEQLMKRVPPLLELAKQYGNGLGYWQEYCRPRIQGACKDLRASPAGTSPREIAKTWGYGLHQTFLCLGLLGFASIRLNTLLAEYVGAADAALLALEVTQGGENPSQMIDGEIWELAALARANKAVAAILSSTPAAEALTALRAEKGAADFVVAFDALIERHGARSQGWTITWPTWGERPEAPLALIRAQLERPGVAPDELAASCAERRSAATARALAAIPPDKHDEFHQLVKQLDGYVTVREDRAYWQMVLTGEVRHALLRTGEQLVKAGRIEGAHDVMFLELPELEGGAGDLRGVVRERRAEWERWSRVKPPPFIGTPGEISAAAPVSTQDELRGAPASRGTVTGAARILRSVEEGDRLQPGDILVCHMTTPAWTPLFSLAAGIVTETGGPLSHPAITAREYGIPAVLAVKDATSLISDGQVVTVDGAAGTVTL